MDDISKRTGFKAEEDATSMAVDFALVISRMVNSAKDDPVELRNAIYELARAKLADQLLTAPSSERKQMRVALETAITGVEHFSRRKDIILEGRRQAQLASTEQAGARQVAVQQPAPALSSPTGSNATHWATPASIPLLAGDSDAAGLRERTEPRFRAMLLRGGLFIIMVIAILAVAFYPRNAKFSLANLSFLNWQIDRSKKAPEPQAANPAPVEAAKSPATIATPVVAPAPSSLLPSSFGVYAVSDGKLFSLEALPGRVPDRRVAISGEIRTPASTTLPNGRAGFIVFRREPAGSTPDRVEVRVTARIMREMTFEAGKPKVSATGDTWAIRNIAFPYLVSPVRDNPDMIEIRPEDPNFTLDPGRYALVVRGVGYDFLVAGPMTSPNQCLEQTQAANGVFYSECNPR